MIEQAINCKQREFLPVNISQFYFFVLFYAPFMVEKGTVFGYSLPET